MLLKQIWLGGKRDAGDRKKWVWIDGSEIKYFAWGNPFPNDYKHNEDCLQVTFIIFLLKNVI